MRFRSLLCGLLTSCLVLSTFPARAELLGSAQLLSQAETADHRAQVQAFLDRTDVLAQMEQLGVSPELAAERVAALTGAELQALAQHMDEMPAGAGALEVVVVVLLVLIILELLGTINIFPKI